MPVACFTWVLAAIVLLGLGFLVQAILIAKRRSVPAWFRWLLNILWIALLLGIACRMAILGSVDQIMGQILGIVFLIVLGETLFSSGRALARWLIKKPDATDGN